jgi:hypothetical protein
MADCEVAARVGLARLRRVERMQNLKKRTSLGVNIPRPVFRRCCEASIVVVQLFLTLTFGCSSFVLLGRRLHVPQVCLFILVFLILF